MKKITMDKPMAYQIKVPGVINSEWSDWVKRMDVNVEFPDKKSPITSFTGELDQAALLGLLRQFNSLGLPLISVVCLDYESNIKEKYNDYSGK